MIETKKKDEKKALNKLWSYMSVTTTVFGALTNGDGIMYYHYACSALYKKAFSLGAMTSATS